MRQASRILQLIIKDAINQDDLQVIIDEMKDVLSRTWEAEKRQVIIESIRDLERFDGPVAWEEFERIEARAAQQLGAGFAAKVARPLIDIGEAAYGMGLTEAGAAAGVDIMWNLPDLKSLDVLNRNTMFWVGEYYDANVQDSFREVLRKFFEGGYTRDQVADLLAQEFQGLGPKTKAYWDMLADHTCTKVREVGRLSGYEQAGVEYLEVRAWLDGRTTLICRSLHGRLILVGEVRKYVDNYLAACETADKEKIKAAWPMWSEKKFRSAGVSGAKSAALPGKGVGLPPYHFNCRTITVPYFEVLQDGVNVVNQGTQVTFWDGEKEVSHKVAWEHNDRLGRKITVTQELIEKVTGKEPSVSIEKLTAGLDSIDGIGENKRPETPGESVYKSQNGLLIFLRGNVITSAYFPTAPLDVAFTRATLAGSKIRVKSRWPFQLFS